jgi:hypothetical protein
LATLAPARPTRAADDGGAPASASGDAGSTADAGLGSAVVSASRRGLVVPPDLDDVEHMCALLTGCASLPITSAFAAQGFVACVRRVWDELASPGAVQFSLTLRECGLRASSCGDLRACALRGARPDACAGRGKQGAASHCDADGRAITCLAEQVTSVRDCPRGGEQCAIREGGAACVLGACEADTPRACSASGTKILQCDRGKLLSMDCAALGLRCASGPSGPACATTSAACSGGGKRCEGATAVTCLNGHEVKIDCAAAGLECGGSADALAVGACATSSVPSCDASAPPRCDGAILKYCAAGRPRGYFCKSLGLSRCVTDARGARCAP